MPTYKVRPQNYWGGSWASTLAEGMNESTPLKLKQAHDYLHAGNIQPGDVIEFIGDDGPFDLRDAQDFPASSKLQTEYFAQGGGSANRPITTGSNGRLIYFGNDSDNTDTGAPSKASGVSFVARGGAPYNFDMRGIAVAADRQSAVILLQGYDMVVDGFKVRGADWCPILSGRISYANAYSPYAAEASWENIGIWVRGAWGSRILNSYAHGGDVGHSGICVEMRTHSTDWNTNSGKVIEVAYCEAESWGVNGISVKPGGSISGAAGNTVNRMPYNSRIWVHHNKAHDGHWQALTGGDSYADHTNLYSVWGCALGGAWTRVHDNEGWGNCQDAFVMMGANQDFFSNYMRDLCPGVVVGDSMTALVGVGSSTLTGFATGWNNASQAIAGNLLKTGLGQTYQGTDGVLWGDIGTPGGSQNWAIDEHRVRVFRNRFGAAPGAVTANGGSSVLWAANELDNPRGYGFSTGSSRTARGKVFGTNNYSRARVAMDLHDYWECLLFNNILVANSTYALRKSGSNGFVRGSNNCLSGSTSGTLGLVNTTTAAPDYLIGTGPTAGGNCDAKGAWGGPSNARMSAALKDFDGHKWRRGQLPIGPRQLLLAA